MMRLRNQMWAILAVATLGAAVPASAQQLYKWVDERGVTNYSNQPPADPKSAKNVRPVEDRLSVYSPDQGLVQAIEDGHKNFDQRQKERARVEALERQLEAERQARQQSAAAAQQARLGYERCVAEGRPECNEVYGVYGPYYPPVVVVPPRHRRHQQVPQTVLKPGTTAGNVTADNNFIPGNSASANAAPPGQASHRRPPERRIARPVEERATSDRR
jgi:hypothetical protein